MALISFWTSTALAKILFSRVIINRPKISELGGTVLGPSRDAHNVCAVEKELPLPQSRTQSPQAFWSAGGRRERLWDNGILLPQDFCGTTMHAVAEQPIKKCNFFRILLATNRWPKSPRTLGTRLALTGLEVFAQRLSNLCERTSSTNTGLLRLFT